MTRQAVPGVYSLAVECPELIPDWHPTKNGDLTPDTITPASGRKVWWQCQYGHEWQATVANRSRQRSGCPYCAGNVAVPGKNDLATVRPDLAAGWHPTKNGDLTPNLIARSSDRKVWWQCTKGHEWRASAANRYRGAGCPYCAGRRVLAGSNDLASHFPDLAAEWHPTKNGDLTPEGVSRSSGRVVWWQCAKGHEWRAAVNNRIRGRGCPYCSGYFAWAGDNDLATVRPDLAAQWHPTKNGDLTAQGVTRQANRKVWWQCAKGHEWLALVSSRDAGNGCPYCAGHRAWPGESDLATLRPDIAREWHPTKNGDLTPQDVTAPAATRVWWQCPAGHEWRAVVYNRLKAGCPRCNPGGFDSTRPGWVYFLADDNRDLLQIGISNVPESRLRTHELAGWRLVGLDGPMPGDLARQWERDILAAVKRRGAVRPKHAGLAPFDGHTESWKRTSLPVESLSALRAMVRADEA